MSAYLFVHFRERTTPDGEQVYFALSRDGFCWEEVNGGSPVLWAYYGDKGVRDFTVARDEKRGRFYIVATDLSLSYGFRNQYHGSWEEISRNGSKCLSVWESDNLTDWSEQRLLQIGDEDFGCLWAPDVIYDREKEAFLLHWSSSHKSNGYGEKGIYCCYTQDFRSVTRPELLFQKHDSGVIDSAIYQEDGVFYMFVKSEKNPAGIILLRSDHAGGPYERVFAFDKSMEALESGKYEAPTAVRLEDGRWCLFLDYYGVPGAGQGYVPFVASSLAKADFVRSDRDFSFPYGFKHGTILRITGEEYQRIRGHDWSDKGYVQEGARTANENTLLHKNPPGG